MDKLIKKNFNIALGETMISKSSYKVEMLTTSSVSFRKEFLRNTKTLLTHGTTIQLHVSGLNQTNTRSNVDCIWEKSQIGGIGNGTVDRADVFEKLEQLETSSSPFKHAISDIVSFLAQNNYGTFTTSQHSSVLRVSVDVTDGQCNCDEGFPANSDETSQQKLFNILTKILYFMNNQLRLFSTSKRSFLKMYLDHLFIDQVIQNFFEIQRLFPSNPTSKNAFLAVCFNIDRTKDLNVINYECEHGGLIGPGNSKLHPLFKRFKLFRIHAAFPDAFGFMKRRYRMGPGYVGKKPLFINSCLLGHFTGISFWMYLRISSSETFNNLPF